MVGFLLASFSKHSTGSNDQDSMPQLLTSDNLLVVLTYIYIYII